MQQAAGSHTTVTQVRCMQCNCRGGESAVDDVAKPDTGAQSRDSPSLNAKGFLSVLSKTRPLAFNRPTYLHSTQTQQQRLSRGHKQTTVASQGSQGSLKLLALQAWCCLSLMMSLPQPRLPSHHHPIPSPPHPTLMQPTHLTLTVLPPLASLPCGSPILTL